MADIENTNTASVAEASQKPIEEFESRVLIIARDNDNKVINIQDITEYLFQLDEEGRMIKADKGSKYLETGNKAVVVQVPEVTDNGNSVSVYRLQIQDKEGNVVYTSKSKLEYRESIEMFDYYAGLTVTNDKINTEKFIDELKKTSYMSENLVEIKAIGNAIEETRKKIS